MTENVNVTQAAPMQAPLLPIRDLVVFPHTVLPLFIGRPLTIRSVRTAMNGDRKIALVTQKESGRDDPKLEDLYKTGTLARVLQMLKLPDGTLKVLVEADERIDIQSIRSNPKDGYSATYTPHPCVVQGTTNEEASRRAVLQRFIEYAQESKKLPEEVLQPIRESATAMALADAVASQLPVDNARKQKILDQTTLQGCLNEIIDILDNEMDILAVERRIHGRVKKQMEKNQRNYYLNEQIKAIRKELGADDEAADGNDEITILRDKIKACGMPAKTEEKALEELNKLKQMSPSNAEATVVRGYIETLISLPWKEKTTRISRRPRKSSTPITGVWKRSRSASWNTWPCSVESTRSSRRFCVWWALPASARPVSVNQSPAPRAASTCAWLWAACRIRATSAVTAAPTSVRCRARSSRPWPRWA